MKVINRVSVGGVSIFLKFLFYLFFFLRHDSYANPLSVLYVSLLLGGCPAS